MVQIHTAVKKRGDAVVAGKELSVSQAVPMRPEDRQRLRVIAAEQGVGIGLLCRAMIFAGVEMLDDERIRAVLEREIEAEQARQSAAGRAAMVARWGDEGEAKPQGGAQ